MPSSITILCQIKSKGFDGGFVNGLASYMVNFRTFHYGFYKKQVSLFLYDLQVKDYALVCGKCVFNGEDMYVMVSAAFKIEIPGTYELQLPPTGPHISFVGKIYEKPEEQDDDCIFGVNLIEYNNFNFAKKEKLNLKMQIVFEAGPNSHFRKLPSKLEIGQLVFITGFLDLNDNELPFVEAKEIDLLDDFASNSTKFNSQSPFSRTSKFRNNKNLYIKKEKNSDIEIIEVIDNKHSDIEQKVDENNDKKDEESEESEDNNIVNPKKGGSRKKRELMDLSTQCLKRENNNNEIDDNEEIIINQPIHEEPKKWGRKKKPDIL